MFCVLGVGLVDVCWGESGGIVVFAVVCALLVLLSPLNDVELRCDVPRCVAC